MQSPNETRTVSETLPAWLTTDPDDSKPPLSHISVDLIKLTRRMTRVLGPYLEVFSDLCLSYESCGVYNDLGEQDWVARSVGDLEVLLEKFNHISHALFLMGKPIRDMQSRWISIGETKLYKPILSEDKNKDDDEDDDEDEYMDEDGEEDDDEDDDEDEDDEEDEEDEDRDRDLNENGYGNVWGYEDMDVDINDAQ